MLSDKDSRKRNALKRKLARNNKTLQHNQRIATKLNEEEGDDKSLLSHRQLTAEEEQLLDTRPFKLSDKDRRKRNTLRKKLSRNSMSSKDKARNQMQNRAQYQIARDNMSSNDRAQKNKRRRCNWTNMDSDNKSRELKRKAKRESQ